MTTQEVAAVRLHTIARKSKIDALAEMYPEYAAVMGDDEISLKARRSKLTGKASAFFRRPKIRNYIAECREELAADLGITKAEFTEQVLADADQARDDSQHMAVAKNMEIIAKACGFMDTSVTVKHQTVTQTQFEAQLKEEIQLMQSTDPDGYKDALRVIVGDENYVKLIEGESSNATSEVINAVSVSNDSPLTP